MTGSLTIPLEGLGGTCCTIDDDVLLVGMADGSALTYRFRGINAAYSLPVVHMRPTRLLHCGMADAVDAVALDRSADIAVAASRGDVWVYELSRGRLMSRITLAHPTLRCRALAIVDGTYVLVAGDDGTEGEGVAAVSPFLAVYRSADGSLLKQVAVPAPIRVLTMEQRVERWGGCLAAGDTQGVVSLFNPLRLQVMP